MLEDDTIDMPVLCRARAKAVHQAVDENELTLEPGQLVEVLEKGDSGWWLARSENGSVGWAPSNYLTEIPVETAPSVPEPVAEAPPAPEPQPTCHKCEKELSGQYVAVKDKKFHTDCFSCTTCSQSLAGQAYLEKDGGHYCESCFHEKYSPKCAGCTQPIKGKFISALEQAWHRECFVCASCAQPFAGDKFRKHEGKPYCDEHYQALFASKCEGCQQPIGGAVFEAMGKTFHSECFMCAEDGEVIAAGEPFYLKDEQFFCKQHFQTRFLQSCHKCKQPIEAEMVRVLDAHFHAACWSCGVCNVSLDGLAGVQRLSDLDDQFVCGDCAVKHDQEVEENARRLEQEARAAAEAATAAAEAARQAAERQAAADDSERLAAAQALEAANKAAQEAEIASQAALASQNLQQAARSQSVISAVNTNAADDMVHRRSATKSLPTAVGSVSQAAAFFSSEATLTGKRSAIDEEQEVQHEDAGNVPRKTNAPAYVRPGVKSAVAVAKDLAGAAGHTTTAAAVSDAQATLADAEANTEFYPVDQLRSSAEELPAGVNMHKREIYLSAADFQTVFKCTKPEFYAKKAWQQAKMKKDAQLW